MTHQSIARQVVRPAQPPTVDTTMWFPEFSTSFPPFHAGQPLSASSRYPIPSTTFNPKTEEQMAYEAQLEYWYASRAGLVGAELADVNAHGEPSTPASPVPPPPPMSTENESIFWESTSAFTTTETVNSSHAYRPLPSIDQDTVDQWLESYDFPDKRAYRCVWPGCSEIFPRNKYNARLHAHKHLGASKLFECVTCGQQFMSEANAKRHRDNQIKVFRCDFCDKKFARKDYCHIHRTKCTKRK